MQLNGKSYKQWTEEDLRTLLDNDDFREGQFLDYKRTFDFLEATDKNKKVKAKNELRNDICSFANADGGEIIVGISEKNGLASKINPIVIDNIDRFELELHNTLLPIQPAMPPTDFAFIRVENGYVVVIHIEKGIYKPYITVEEQTTFRFFVRRGNGKGPMSYSEITNSFLHAASLAAEIKRFRVERLSELIEDNTDMFGVIHVIPATFTNSTDFIPIYDLCKTEKLLIPIQFIHFKRGRMLPNVDGVWFPSEDGQRDFQLLRIFNNGSVELKYNFSTLKYQGEEYLESDEFIQAIGDIVKGTVEIYKVLGRSPSVYVCTSIIGCKGYFNYDTRNSIHPLPSKVDRDRIICAPIEIEDISDVENVKEMIKECMKMTRYALGRR